MVLPVWQKLLEHQCAYLRSHSPVFQANKQENTKVAVIVEPRRHPMLEPVVRNVMHHLGPDWNLEIMTHVTHVPHIEKNFGGCTLRVATLPYPNMNQNMYNQLLLDPWFWWHLPEEHVFIFQTDCILFGNDLAPWLKYDYCGANYFHPRDVAPITGGIQGGLSLRRKSVMLECIQKVSWQSIQYYRTFHGYEGLSNLHEDVFFTHACEILKKKVPPVERRKLFSIEAEYWDKPLGHHGTTKPYFHDSQIEAIISQCEDRAMWSLP